MADSAHVQTDKKIEEMERHLTSIYRRANKEVKATADKYFKKFEAQDKKKRELVESGELDEKTYQQWRMNKLAYGKRYEDMQNQIAAEMLNANKTATAYINGELPEVYALNYNSLAPDVEGLGGYSFTLTDAQTIKNLATEDETLLPYKEVDGRKDVRWNTRKVNSEVLQGILQGDSIPKIASRMQDVTSMNLVSAVRNARTSVTSAECKGRFDSYKQAEKDGIVLKKVWVSTEDGRTRHTHVMLDGQEVAPDKPFKSELGDIMYPADPTADPANIYNCRCTTIAKVEGFKKARVEEVMEQREEKALKDLPEEINARMGQIDKYLTKTVGLKSHFNGKTEFVKSMGGINGKANYDGSIVLRAGASTKTQIHELLHEHSIGGEVKINYFLHSKTEEGSVELLAQEICKKNDIPVAPFDFGYSEYVNALRRINKVSGTYDSDYDFALNLFRIPITERKAYLQSLKGSVSKENMRFYRSDLKKLGC